MKRELAAITAYYGNRTAKRSGVPLINHIHEGFVVLREVQAWHRAYSGWCLHPLVQDNAALLENLKTMIKLDTNPRNMALAMEYRAVANAWLSDKVDDNMMLIGEPQLSPIKCVNDMLRADKVQNRKDFEKYHKATHPRSKQLTRYFDVWLDRLGITEEQYQYLCAKIDEMYAGKPEVINIGPAQKFLPGVIQLKES